MWCVLHLLFNLYRMMEKYFMAMSKKNVFNTRAPSIFETKIVLNAILQLIHFRYDLVYKKYSRGIWVYFCTLLALKLVFAILPSQWAGTSHTKKETYLEMHGPSPYQLMIEIKDGYQVIIKPGLLDLFSNSVTIFEE